MYRKVVIIIVIDHDLGSDVLSYIMGEIFPLGNVLNNTEKNIEVINLTSIF